MLGIVSTAVAAPFLSNSVEVDNGVSIGVSGGPSIMLTGSAEANLTDFYDGNTVTLNTSGGNVSFTSDGNTEGRIDVSEINTTWTRVTQVEASGANLTIDTEDKDPIGVQGSVSSFNFTEVKANDGETDIKYTSSGSDTQIVVYNLTADAQYTLVESGGGAIDVASADDSGKVVFADPPDGTHSVRVTQLANLTLRTEMPPHNQINETAHVTFYEDTETDPMIRNFTVTNGTLNVTGLPIDNQFVVTVSAENYHNNTVVIDNFGEQNTIFLLNRSEPAVENRFTFEDRSGDFQPEETDVTIQKAINQSLYDTGGYEWLAVSGDTVGADQAYITTLRENDRYRIVIKNDDGDQRILGAYDAKANGTINLQIGRVGLDPEGTDQPAVSVTRTNETGDPVRINFEYNDSTTSTSVVYLKIYEYNNESNVLLPNTSIIGPFGTLMHVEDVPAAQNETTWAVEYTAQRNGEDDISGRAIVGPRQPVLPDLPQWLVTVVFVGSIWMVAGLFSQLNGSIGAIVVAGLGALFFFVDLVPPELGGGVLVLSLITAGIIFIRERQGVGL